MTRDELISAYLDGELDAGQAAEFERQVEQDPALAAELSRLASNDDLLRSAVRRVAPDDDAQAAGRFGLERPIQRPAPRVAANENRPLRWVLAGGALAASLAVILLINPLGRGDPSGGFDRALDATPSLQRAALAGGNSMTPVLTFAAADGRYCREYRLAGPSRAERAGIACRGPRSWQIVASAPAQHAANPGDIQLAGGPGSPELDAAYARLGGSDPLGPAQEKALIAAGWRPKK